MCGWCIDQFKGPSETGDFQPVITHRQSPEISRFKLYPVKIFMVILGFKNVAQLIINNI